MRVESWYLPAEVGYTPEWCPTPKKVTYLNEATALKALNEQEEGQHRLKPYHCQCGRWHLSHLKLILLREDRAARRWSVALTNDGCVAFSMTRPGKKAFGITLREHEARALAEALVAPFGGGLHV